MPKKTRKTGVSPQPEIPVVGIGYSAGGLKPVKLLLKDLPRDSGMAFVIVQHLQPDEKSHLSEILAKHTRLKVKEITNNMRVTANTVFVIPPGFDVALSGNYLNLNPRGESSVHFLGIDFFFSSLSQNRKSKAVGVLLSGSGADGTVGLKAIKSEGGICIVQDPKTATFDSMPGSAVVAGVADLILPPEDIGKELIRIGAHPYTAEAIKGATSGDVQEPAKTKSKSIFSGILDILFSQTKIDFSKYKSTTINRRIERQMMLRKIESIDRYAEFLSKNPEEIKALYEDIFIHVTDFFRDSEAFEALRKKVFPELIRGRDSSAPVRIWVPGCATGEEVYSLAISFIEYLEESGHDVPLNIFAGDISEPAIQKARKGAYADYQLRNVSQKRIDRFFDRVKGGYKIRKQIRDLCIFARHDIASNPPIPNVDLISCRNVLIYFSTELQKRVLPVFHYSLNPNGYLWLGKAESPDSNARLFSAVDKTQKIFKKEKASSAGQPRFSSASYPPSVSEMTAPSPSSLINDTAKSVDQVLLYRYSPPSVVINSDLEILQFKGKTFPYLEPSPGAVSYSLLKMINPEIMAPLRVCIQTAKRDGLQVRKEGVTFDFDGKKRRVNLDVSPLNPTAAPKERQYLIVFEDPLLAKSPASKAKTSEKIKSPGKKGESQIHTLMQYVAQLQTELDNARDYHQSLIEEYETSQEELTSANEELRSTNEELQSTNEELHSTNEELGTAQEELQATNEEYLSTNEELQKRNVDLENAMANLEISERRFRLMIAGVKDYAIFMLDPQGQIVTWNEGAARLKGYTEREIVGSHFSRFYTSEDIARKHSQEELQIASETGKYEEEGWRVRKDGTRFWASVLITAIRDSGGKLLGFSKVTRDLTERKKASEELKRSEERFRLMVTEIEDYAIFMLDPEGKVTTWNEGAKRLKGYEEAEIVGQHFSKFYPKEDGLSQVPAMKLNQARSEGRVEDEGWRVRKDGSQFWANVVITRIDGANGELIGFAKITRDLTQKREIEQKRIEDARRAAQLEQVQENERILDQIFDESPSFMALVSVPELRYIKSNAVHRKLIGKSNILGKTVFETEPGLEAQGFIKIMQEVIETRKPYVGKEVRVNYGAANGESARTAYLDFIYQPLERANGAVYAIAAQGYEVTAKVLARKAIENERENFRNLFKQTPEMVCILQGPEHTFEFVNEAHVKALGFDATGMKVREAQPESVEVHGILDNVYRTGITANLNEIPVTLTDRLRFFNLTYSARRDESGAITGIMILGVEVTEQVETREVIKRNSQQLKSLADSISHIVWMTDANGKVEYYNKRWYDYTGFSEAESGDIKIWKRAIHPEDYERIRNAWHKSIASGNIFETEWRMRNQEGDYRWHLVRTVPAKSTDGQITRWIGTSTDIDEQRRVRERDRVLADAATIFVESLDVEKTLQSLANMIVKELADWCSIDLAQEGGLPHRAAVAHPNPDRLKLVQELLMDYPTDWSSPVGAPNVMRTGKAEIYPQITEQLLIEASKDQRHGELLRDLGMRSAMVVPLSARGKTLGVITIVSSESGRVYTERDLEVAEEIGRRIGVAVDNAILYQQLQRAVRTRDEFLSIASHELKTPLTTLGLQAQITNLKLKKGELSFFTPEQLQKFSNQVSSQVGRLVQLVDDMLDVSRVQTGKIEPRPEPVDLGELAERITDQLLPLAKSAECKLDLSVQSVDGFWDRSRIEQVLVNLITNAIKYGARKPIEVKVLRDGDRAKIEVRDYGIGIGSEHHHRIFERFERAVPAEGITGLGLGLYITKNIVNMHKGEISLKSELGEGTTFTVVLPLDPFNIKQSKRDS